MSGITVLKTYEALIDRTWGWSWPGALAMVPTLVAAGVLIWYIIKKKDYSAIAVVIIVLGFGSYISGFSFSYATPIYETYQDVYLHGNIDMDEFTAKYRIIEQDGLIFTITEVGAIEGE